MITLTPSDVPGAQLRQGGSRVEDHSKLELQRWLECHGLQKNGNKAELVQRVVNCITAGRENYIFLGVDGGKWYDAKCNVTVNAVGSSTRATTQVKVNASSTPATTAVSSSTREELDWKTFPSCDIPKYFNKGHIYTYIAGAHFESEDFEIYENQVTEKPFRRGNQFVGSDYIHDVHDATTDKLYHLKAKCFSSFRKDTVYSLRIILNNLSGSVISANCICKQSALGRCSHVGALLLFLAKFTEDYGHNRLSSTSQLRQWGLGAKLKRPGPVASKYYPTVRFHPLRRAVFDPRPSNYKRQVNVNNFICDIQRGLSITMFETVLPLKYDDFDVDREDLEILNEKVLSFKTNMEDYMKTYNKNIFIIKGAEIQGSEGWHKWRHYFFTASTTKIASSLRSTSAKTNYLKKHLWHLTPDYYYLASLQYGTKNEPLARSKYIAGYLNNGEAVVEVGLCANKHYPHLACSVDGVVMKNNKIQRIIEIKCPFNLRNADPNNFCTVLTPQQKSSFCLEKQNGTVKLKANHPYLYQVATSMLIFNVPVCDFVVWSKVNTLVFKVKMSDIDAHVIEDILVNLRHRYYNMYIPELFLMKIPRNLPLYELTPVN